MILYFVVAFLGVVTGYVGYNLRLKRNRGLWEFIDCVNKKGIYVFLETASSVFGRKIIHTDKNLAITTDKDFVIMPAGTVKSCSNFGIQMGHGDLYKSILIPKDLPVLVGELKSEQNMSESEIGQFFEEALKINRDTLKKICSGEFKPDGWTDKKLNVYKTFNSNITGFIHTGMNRVSIAQNVEHLIKRENILKLGQRNWVNIAIAGFLILLGLGIAIKFAAPSISQMISAASSTSGSVPPIK